MKKVFAIKGIKIYFERKLTLKGKLFHEEVDLEGRNINDFMRNKKTTFKIRNNNCSNF